MLIQESYHDVATTADGQGTMRVYPEPILSLYNKPVLTIEQAFMSSIPQFPAIRTPASQAWLSSARSTKVGPIAITAITATHHSHLMQSLVPLRALPARSPARATSAPHPRATTNLLVRNH